MLLFAGIAYEVRPGTVLNSFLGTVVQVITPQCTVVQIIALWSWQVCK